MSKPEPWQKAEVPGPMKALVISKPEAVVAMIKSAKRPLFIVGPESAGREIAGEKEIDQLIQIAKAGKIPIVATSRAVIDFTRRNYDPALWMPAVDIANRLRDPKWMGVKGEGQHDLALFAGMQYYVEWLLLSGLKHFGDVRTVSFGRFYQPHANWSFPNLDEKEWEQNLRAVRNGFGRVK